MIGITRTKDVVMRSKRIPAVRRPIGNRDGMHEDDLLESATDALVESCAPFSLAQRTAKKLINDSEDASLSSAIELEGHCYSRLRASEISRRRPGLR